MIALYLGGTPYPIFEVLILLIVLFFVTSVYFGLNYEVVELEDDERRDAGGEVFEP